MIINTPEFKVGALVLIVSGIIGGMSMIVAKGPSVLTGSRHYWFELPDANGLVKKGVVKMAGIKVGVIDDIELVESHAKIHILVEKRALVKPSSRIEIRSDGILGDKHVEIVPGKEGEELLASGSQITNVENRGSLDNIMGEVGKIADTLNKSMTGDGDPNSTIGRIVLNIEKLTKDLSDISGQNKQQINEIISQVNGITKTLDDLINDTGPNGFKVAWQKALDSLHRLDRSLKNVEEITEKINDGKGTIGRLINDEDTVDNINEAIENVNGFLGGASRMETALDFHGESMPSLNLSKSILNVRIQPGLDRYYEIGIVDDSRGVIERTRIESTGSTTGDFTEKKTYFNKTKFNAIFAKNFWNFTLKGGIMENAGGFGVDYYLLRRKLRLSVEAFDFQNINVRAFAKYSIFSGIYLIGGGDKIGSADSTPFIGAGIFLTNDDLKLLASKAAF